MAKSTKVFVIGFHKTGTTSMHYAFQIIGYKTGGPNFELYDDCINGNISTIMRIAAKYDMVQDYPWFLLYKELDKYFLDAKFILTERDPEGWLSSMIRYNRQYQERDAPERVEHVYGSKVSISNEPDVYIERYNRHNREVKKYFIEAPSEKLLVFNLVNGDGWDKLCTWLGEPIPKTLITRRTLPFPKANSKEYLSKVKKYKRFYKYRQIIKVLIIQYFGAKAFRQLLRIKDFFSFEFHL